VQLSAVVERVPSVHALPPTVTVVTTEVPGVLELSKFCR